MQDKEANIENVVGGFQEMGDDFFTWGHDKFVVGNVPNNQTLVDPNRHMNARDIFAESVFEEM